MKKTIATIALLLFTTLFNSVISQTNSGESFAITNATIIDVERSQQIKNRTILIENGIIKSILHSDSVSLEWIERIVDVNGSYIIPGLIDSHVHLFRPKNRNDILSELLYSGVTAVRDMGGDARMYQSLNQEISKGNLMGPDIYYSANVFGPTFLKDPRTKFAALGFEPGSAPWMRLITEETDLTRVVIDAKEAGVTGLKVYSNVNPELLLKLSEIARENGLKMWSHSSVFPSRPSDAVKAQVDVLSHSVGMIFELEENMPASFNEAIRESVPLQDFKNTDATASEFLSLFEEMKSRNLIFEPTLSAWETQERTQVSEISSQNQKENPTKHLSGSAERLDPEALNDWAYRITKAAYQNGVTIAAGTDFNLSIKWVQDEIILLTKSGLSKIDAIKAATLNNAKTIGIEHTHGSLAVGKTANLVVLSGNPLENIEHIRTVVSVFKNGKEYKKTQ